LSYAARSSHEIHFARSRAIGTLRALTLATIGGKTGKAIAPFYNDFLIF
jgi:hypothetical protein